MRRDYVEPDDFEYEPTAHDEVLKRARRSEQGTGIRDREQGPIDVHEPCGEQTEQLRTGIVRR